MGENNKQAGAEVPNLTEASDGLVKQADRPFTELTQLTVVAVLLALICTGVDHFWPYLNPFQTSTLWAIAAFAIVVGIILRGVYGAIAQYLVASNALIWERTHIHHMRELMAAQHAYAMQQQQVAQMAAKAATADQSAAGPRPMMRFEDFLDAETQDSED